MSLGVLSLPLSSVLTGQPEVIGHSVLAGAAASVRFDFPPVYRAVLIEAYIKKDASGGNVYIRCNNDSGVNYSYQYIHAQDVTVTGARQTGATQWNLSVVTTLQGDSRMSLSALVVKTTAAARGQMVGVFNYNDAAIIRAELAGGEWNNTTDLLTRIDVSTPTGNFAANTSITLFGWRH